MTVSAGGTGMSRFAAVTNSSGFAPWRAARLSNQAIGSMPPSGSSSFLFEALPGLGGGAILYSPQGYVNHAQEKPFHNAVTIGLLAQSIWFSVRVGNCCTSRRLGVCGVGSFRRFL